MSAPPVTRFAEAVAAWVDFCQRRAPAVVLAALALSVAAGVYLADNIRIDTDTEDMLSTDLAFRMNATAIDDAFPGLEDNLLIVFEAPNADAADFGARRLADALAEKEDVFRSVLAPVADPFLRRNGLLYSEIDDLETLSSRLAAAQPFLGTLWQAPNLAGLAKLTALLREAEVSKPSTLDEASRVLGRMAEVAANVKSGKGGVIVWSELLDGDSEVPEWPARRLIVVQPVLDYGSLQPADRASAAVYETASALGLTGNGLSVRLTGSPALESDELKSVEQGMGVAGIVSVVLVTVVLFVGFRSPAAILALLLTLGSGLLWTAALAIAILGAFNLISVAFAVLFVGLSVDFGIHYALRAAERGTERDWPGALVDGARSAGPSMALCALTTAVAFFSFLPTAYVGLAELGLIAGLGMGVALIANLTLLPALLRLMRARPRSGSYGHGAPGASAKWLQRHAKAVVAVGAVSVVGAGWLAFQTRFDFDPMNLRSPAAPSVRTLVEVADAGLVHPYSAEILTENLAAADALMGELSSLPTVAAVGSIHDLVPAEQEEKLEIIDNMSLFLGPAFFSLQGRVEMDDDKLIAAKTEVRDNLDALKAVPGLADAADAFGHALTDIDTKTTHRINQALFAGLPDRLDSLLLALEAEAVTFDTLPERLRRRYVSEDGRVRIEVVPTGDTLADVRNPVYLRAFVEDLHQVAPMATGPPVIVVEAGKAVLSAFAKALLISAAAITVILWVTLRRFRDVVLVFVPVAVAAVWILAASRVFGVPFNFANVIVLPLLFGLSVDFGIHLVMRARGGGDPMTTSTPRAVLLSALTTLGSFGAIMLSGHPGTSSMGQLLTIAIVLSLIAVLILLPALLALVTHERDGA